ncbi:Acsf3 [Scenedesmus sp. PABB004]|nr:Acsf3 [Scenedesmus sp. PABB004]
MFGGLFNKKKGADAGPTPDGAAGLQFASTAAAALAASANVSTAAKGPSPTGRALAGSDVTIDLDALRPGEAVPELQVQPITLLKFDYALEHTQQVAISAAYICYGLKAGHIRALNRNTASRALFKGHTSALSHMAFFAPPDGAAAAGGPDLLASASRNGDVAVRAVSDAPGPDGDAVPAEVLLLTAQLALPPGGAPGASLVRLAWHPTTPQILAAGAAGAVHIFEVPTSPPASQPPAPALPGITYTLPPGGGDVTAVAFSPLGDLLAAADSAGRVHAWWLEGDDEAGAPLLSWSPFAAPGGVASLHFLAQALDGSSLLLTGDATNAALKLWRLARAGAAAGAAPQCLQSVAFTSAKGAPDFFCHAVVQRELGLVVLANTVRKQVYTLHYALAPGPVAGGGLDYAAFFAVKQPILSLTPGLEAVESQAVPGEVAPQQLLLYTVQTDAIQQYVLSPALCAPPPGGEDGVEPGDEASSSSAPVPAPAPEPAAAAAEPPAPEPAAVAEPEPEPEPAAPAVEAVLPSAAVPPPAQLPTPGLLLHGSRLEKQRTADKAAAAAAAAAEAAASARRRAEKAGAPPAGGDVAALQQQMQALLAMQHDLAAALAASSQQTVAGVKAALKGSEASLAKGVEASLKAQAKRAEEERRKAAAKERADLEKLLAAQLGQLSSALQAGLVKAMADTAREQARAAVAATVNAVTPAVAQAVAGALQHELAGGAGGGLQAVLERSLAGSLARPLHEALRENFAGSIIPAFERATQVMFGQVEGAFAAWLADSGRAVSAAQGDAAAALNASVAQLQGVVAGMRGELADTSRSLSRLASTAAERSAGSGGGALSVAQLEAGRAAPAADPRLEISTLLGVRKYEDALVRALNTASLDVVLWTCKQARAAAARAHARARPARVRPPLTARRGAPRRAAPQVDPALVLGGSPLALSQPTLLSLVHQLASDLRNDANAALKLAWLAEAAPVLDPHDATTAPHLKGVLTGVMAALKALVASLPGAEPLAKKAKVTLHLFNSLLHQMKATSLALLGLLCLAAGTSALDVSVEKSSTGADKPSVTVTLPTKTLQIPDIKIPSVSMPEVKLPDMKMPDVKLPRMPKLSLPGGDKNISITVPTVDLSALSGLLQKPNVDLSGLTALLQKPNLTMPDLSALSAVASSLLAKPTVDVSGLTELITARVNGFLAKQPAATGGLQMPNHLEYINAFLSNFEKPSKNISISLPSFPQLDLSAVANLVLAKPDLNLDLPSVQSLMALASKKVNVSVTAPAVEALSKMIVSKPTVSLPKVDLTIPKIQVPTLDLSALTGLLSKNLTIPDLSGFKPSINVDAADLLTALLSKPNITIPQMAAKDKAALMEALGMAKTALTPSLSVPDLDLSALTSLLNKPNIEIEVELPQLPALSKPEMPDLTPLLALLSKNSSLPTIDLSGLLTKPSIDLSGLAGLLQKPNVDLSGLVALLAKNHTLPTIPTLSIPTLAIPSLTIPTLTIPAVTIPEVDLSGLAALLKKNISMPDVDLSGLTSLFVKPTVDLSALTGLLAKHNVSMPALSMPTIDLSGLAKLALAKPDLNLSLPDVSSLVSLALSKPVSMSLPTVTVPGLEALAKVADQVLNKPEPATWTINIPEIKLPSVDLAALQELAQAKLDLKSSTVMSVLNAAGFKVAKNTTTKDGVNVIDLSRLHSGNDTKVLIPAMQLSVQQPSVRVAGLLDKDGEKKITVDKPSVKLEPQAMVTAGSEDAQERLGELRAAAAALRAAEAELVAESRALAQAEAGAAAAPADGKRADCDGDGGGGLTARRTELLVRWQCLLEQHRQLTLLLEHERPGGGRGVADFEPGATPMRDVTCAVHAGGGAYSYGQLLAGSEALAAQLGGLLPPAAARRGADGPRVGIWAAPGPHYVAATWATWMAGGIAVPLAVSHPPAELDYVLRDAGCAAVLAPLSGHGALRDVAAAAGAALHLVDDGLLGAGDAASGAHGDGARGGGSSGTGGGGVTRSAGGGGSSRGDGAGALIIYTSGTTGRPKGALHTHGSLAAQVACLTAAWRWRADDAILNALPLHHVHGVINALHCAHAAGAAVHFLPRFSPAAAWQELMAGGVSVLMAVPTMYRYLLDHHDSALTPAERAAAAGAAAALRLAVAGSAAAPVALLARWRALAGGELLERYGMTETGMILSNPYEGERRPGFVGVPLPGVEVKLVPAPGDAGGGGPPQGELAVRGPGLFREYWGRPEATDAAFDGDGWFLTGDTVSLEGAPPYYRIVGRTSVDVIKTGGFKVSALDVEGELLHHAGVAEAAVLGLPHDTLGEAVAALVVPCPGAALDEAALRAHAAARLPPYAVPRVWRLLDAPLPRNAMGKVNKRELAAAFFPDGGGGRERLALAAAAALLLVPAPAAAARAQDAARPPSQACGEVLEDEAVVGSAMRDRDGRLVFAEGVVPGALAHGVYVDSAFTASNFGKLRIVTAAGVPDAEQLAAAGFLEGYLSAARINDHHHNLKHYFIHQLDAKLDKPMQWIAKQEAWLRRQAAARASDPYWRVMALLLAQLDGLWEGYDAAMTAAAAASAAAAREAGGGAAAGAPHHEHRLTREGVVFLNSNGELYDVLDMYDAHAAAARRDAMGPAELFTHLATLGAARAAPCRTAPRRGQRAGKCSALVKVAADLSDIFFGHSTWDSYTAMTRIYKHYELALTQVPGGVVGQSLSFSSYPGELLSDDDFYISSGGLVVLETTNHIFNPDLFKALTPASVPSWMRVRAANLLAGSGSAWVDVFRRHNSGTYNNQYMVVDLKRFEPRQQLRDGLLWVVEQLPGMVEAADMTQVLARGHWPSYNVAFFPAIYAAAGYPDLVNATRAKGKAYDQPARWLMYQVSPRASIFRRDQAGVADLDGMARVMRYNDWQADPLSGGHPLASVCGRGDLAPPGAEPLAVPKGGYDTKVTSASRALAMEAEAVGGPTAQGQPPFEWGDRWEGFAHRGMPERYDFKFETMAPSRLPLPGLECTAGAPAAVAAV